jgi:hypothetical protein
MKWRGQKGPVLKVIYSAAPWWEEGVTRGRKVRMLRWRSSRLLLDRVSRHSKHSSLLPWSLNGKILPSTFSFLLFWYWLKKEVFLLGRLQLRFEV